MTAERKALHIWDLRHSSEGRPLLVLGFFFLLGVGLGTFAGYHISAEGQAAMERYFQSYCAVLQANSTPQWGGLLWRTLRLPLAAALLGLCPLGYLAIPGLTFMRGLLFSFLVSGCGCLDGPQGVLTAFCLFGLGQIVSTLALLLIGVPAWRNARTLALSHAPQSRSAMGRDYLLWCLVLILAALVAAVVGHYLSVVAVRWLGLQGF
jgi:hypothetical protein